VPCKLLAEDLGLKIHQRETFTKWDVSLENPQLIPYYKGVTEILKLPEGTNLVIAVSFGLFVPPRILKSAKYGGLNVHPSLLPE
jgi:methionyl-tRNA formyltransferase